jgi:hypothetical protein
MLYHLDLPTNGDGIGIQGNPSQQQLFTNDIFGTGNKIKTLSLPTGPFIYNMPKH